jgi:hypothetical protein
MGRPAIVLTAAESKLISSIPSAKKAAAIWAKFEARKLAAKADRLALGKELIAVQKATAKKGCKGLFTRWLLTQQIPRERAYVYIGLAGGGKLRTEAPQYQRRMTLLGFAQRLHRAPDNAEKVAILAEVNKYLVEEFDIHVS